MSCNDDSGLLHTAVLEEKPQGILRVQVTRFVCSCGWESKWDMDMSNAQNEFIEHIDIIDYAIKNQ